MELISQLFMQMDKSLFLNAIIQLKNTRKKVFVNTSKCHLRWWERLIRLSYKTYKGNINVCSDTNNNRQIRGGKREI